MANALQSVRDMATEAKKGHTPAVLGQFLREQFPSRRGGWLWRRLLGALTYDVSWIQPFEDGGFFRASCVFWVVVRDDLLEAAVLPSGGTKGLFALGPSGLCYLNHQRENIEGLLRNENRPLEECNPLVLASLVAEGLGREKNSSHDVLESPDHLAGYTGGFDGRYELNVGEWDRVRTSIVSPAISGTTATGWQLEFCSVFGWMHEKQTLTRQRVRFGPDFGIERHREVLSRRIFTSTPGVIY